MEVIHFGKYSSSCTLILHRQLFLSRLSTNGQMAKSFPDKSVSREINNLECLCANEKHGCDWKGALIDINVSLSENAQNKMVEDIALCTISQRNCYV